MNNPADTLAALAADIERAGQTAPFILDNTAFAISPSEIDEWVSRLRALASLKGEAHPDDIAVDKFAAAMKAKMAKQRAKGYGGWDDPADCSADFLRERLLTHVGKGDPVDVGNFAMMLWNRSESTATPSPAPQGGGEACDACGGCGYTNRPSGSHSCWKCAPTPPQPDAGGGEVDYTDIANRAQAVTGRSIWPSTVKAILDVATPPAQQPGEVGEAVSPLLAYSVEFMNGWMQDEADEARRNWQRVRDAALAPKEKGNAD